jgi:hypothetical protein
MVQEFEWSSYPPESQVDFTGKLVFAVVMKNPLRSKNVFDFIIIFFFTTRQFNSQFPKFAEISDHRYVEDV